MVLPVKLRLINILILVAFILPVKAGLNSYTETTPLLFGIDRDYPPLEYVDTNGSPQGLDIVFTQELMNRMNIPFTYSPNTWENISDDVLSGRVDLGMMVYSPYRKNLTNYSRAVFRLYYQILYRDDVKGHLDLRDLVGKSVAYMSSRPIKDTLIKAGAQLYEIKDLSQATKDLSEGRYDAVICFRYQSKYLIEKYNLKNLVANDLTLAPREYCYVSHDKELIDSINVMLDRLESEGYIEQVYGEVAQNFGGFRIPDWVWYLLIALVFVYLLAFIIFQKRYQKRLRQEMERAQRSERMKTVFLGNVSHALRTPLNAIIGFSALLGENSGEDIPPEDVHHLLKIINQNGEQLLYFINELLNLSETESSELNLQRTQLNLRETMESYLNDCRSSLAEGVTLSMEGDDMTTMMDEKYLRIVTKHFLTNAVTHTTQGSVVLRYRIVNGGLHVEVEDTGSGIPDALRQNIFNLLSDKATFVQDEVPGLGLTICKAIVDRFKGQIGAESPEKGGSIFWYWVPLSNKVKSGK